MKNKIRLKECFKVFGREIPELIAYIADLVNPNGTTLYDCNPDHSVRI